MPSIKSGVQQEYTVGHVNSYALCKPWLRGVVLLRHSMMRSAMLIIVLLVAGCSEEQAEEFAFRKTMEYRLKDKCGENEECISAVEEQIESCMKKSDWRKYLDNDEDKSELKRFINEFFPCFRDPNGNSYFK